MLRESVHGVSGEPEALSRGSGGFIPRWLLIAPLVATGALSMVTGWMFRPRGLAVGSYGLLLATVAAVVVWRRMGREGWR
ncbi:MAG TPA: hypothetical protein VIK73_06085 [Limnochordales bacterium]